MQQDPSSPPPDTDQVLISVNPIAGRSSARHRVDRLVGLLRRRGYQSEVHSNLDALSARAAECHAQGRLRAVVGVGGDGTAAELVNRLPPAVPLTMLPAGNKNLLARHLRLGHSPEAVCRTIADGTLVHLDAGSAGRRLFLLMISCGFDAEVVRRVHQRRTGHIHLHHYFRPIWELARAYDYPEMRVYWDQDDAVAATAPVPPLDVRWLFAFNLPYYGAELPLAPQADGTDGLLDVCTFSRGSFWHGLRYTATVMLGRHQAMADCTTLRVRRLRITAEAEVPYQLDGDPGGILPVDVEILPGRLTLLAPPHSPIAPRHT